MLAWCCGCGLVAVKAHRARRRRQVHNRAMVPAFHCGFPAARRRNDGHLVKYPFLNTCSRAASGHAIERVSLLRLGGPRSAAEAVRVVLKSSPKS